MREKNVENTNKSVQMTVYVESRYALDGGASGSWNCGGSIIQTVFSFNTLYISIQTPSKRGNMHGIIWLYLEHCDKIFNYFLMETKNWVPSLPTFDFPSSYSPFSSQILFHAWTIVAPLLLIFIRNTSANFPMKRINHRIIIKFKRHFYIVSSQTMLMHSYTDIKVLWLK